jgi:hypothetical protein
LFNLSLLTNISFPFNCPVSNLINFFTLLPLTLPHSGSRLTHLLFCFLFCFADSWSSWLCHNILRQIMPAVTPDDVKFCRNIYSVSTTPVFYFVTPPSVSPIVIVIMYHLVPTPESFHIVQHVAHISCCKIILYCNVQL